MEEERRVEALTKAKLQRQKDNETKKEREAANRKRKRDQQTATTKKAKSCSSYICSPPHSVSCRRCICGSS